MAPGSAPARAAGLPSGVQMAERPAVRGYPPPVGPAKLATATQICCPVAIRRARSSCRAASSSAFTVPAR
jgi:hypothetical protein